MNPETNEAIPNSGEQRRDIVGDKVAELISRTWTMEPGGEKAGSTPPTPAEQPEQTTYKKIVGKVKKVGRLKKPERDRIYPPGS